MLLDVLKPCSKSRICSDEQFVIQQKFSLIALNMNTLYLSQNTLTTIMCMYVEVWLWAEPARTYVAELAP